MVLESVSILVLYAQLHTLKHNTEMYISHPITRINHIPILVNIHISSVLFTHSSTHLSIHESMSPSVHPSIHQSIQQFINQTIHLTICLFVPMFHTFVPRRFSDHDRCHMVNTRRRGPSTNLLQEWYSFVTESYSFEHIFLHRSPFFSLKYAIYRAQRYLLIEYTNIKIG
jgi:hypothetical protein